MSRAVISTMKKHMSLEERKRFVKNCEIENNEGLKCQLERGRTLENVLLGSFNWTTISEIDYWGEILDRFTPEELSLTINVKKL